MHEFARSWIDDVILASPVSKHLSVSAGELSADTVTFHMPFSEVHTTVPGMLHGGVISALIDIVGAAGSAAGLESEDTATGGVTTHLTVNYLAPGTSDLTATGTVLHRTRSGTLTDVRISDAAGTLVATGQVTSRLLKK